MKDVILQILQETKDAINEITKRDDFDKSTLDYSKFSDYFCGVSVSDLVAQSDIYDLSILSEVEDLLSQIQSLRSARPDGADAMDGATKQSGKSEPLNFFWDKKEKIYYSAPAQAIDGFGVFAGRGTVFYEDKNRDSMLSDLFSKEGLHLSILRAEIDYDYKSSDLEEPINQYWVLRNAKEKYDIDKIFASTWSPPAWMKTIPGQIEGKDFNRLDPKNDDVFCCYILKISMDFERVGIPLYAVSPMNEPEFPTPSWAGTIWLPTDVARFVPKLHVTLNRFGANTKTIIGECANWAVSDIYTFCSLCIMWVSGTLDKVEICASHGYTIPNPLSGDTDVTYNQKSYNWVFDRFSKQRWITEISETTEFDPSMKKGLEFASSLHGFLTRGNVNAFTFWLGVEKTSNECLIKTDGETYTKGKVYSVYGNYTKFISPGYTRLTTSRNTSYNGVLYSAYKDPTNADSLTMVTINQSDLDSDIEFEVVDSGIQVLTPYLTAEGEDNNWKKLDDIHLDTSSNSFKTTIPANSVVTFREAAA
ncbi:hypothetical protein CGLAMM_10730 [Acetobacteraceae bacterium EV16G]|uniref:Endo-beta-1,6-galactanase-like domain-containing protein n=1 Tax=Sorlinia euscelidii TaxID=3081148 RepID=A0ABU7U3W0_9PROT